VSSATAQIKRAYAPDYKDLFVVETIAPGMVQAVADLCVSTAKTPRRKTGTETKKF